MGVSAIGNAILGIAFWAVAAKAFSPHDLGVMTAVLAVIMSTGVVAATGIGDSYTALLPAVGDHRPQFYRRGQRLFLVLAAIGATAAGLGTVTLLSEVYGSIAVGALVAIGTIVWAATTLQNSTLVALGRASWLPAANLALSAGKLALLPLLAVMISWHPLGVVGCGNGCRRGRCARLADYPDCRFRRTAARVDNPGWTVGAAVLQLCRADDIVVGIDDGPFPRFAVPGDCVVDTE